jgi:hypothetical protein
MNAVLELRAADEETAKAPTVFVRTLSTPPGAPWDQARAAALEARVGAPLPLTDVVYRLRRLDPWTLGRPARYAACYVRAREAGDSFQTLVEIDGRSIPIQFLSSAELGRRTKRLTAIGAGIVVMVVILALAVGSAISMRAETQARLSADEMRSQALLRQAQAHAELYHEARLLDGAGVRHRSMTDLLNDLAWVAASKAPGAHIDNFHWERGYIAVETRGLTPPVASVDRAVLKAEKPVRPGVWLWGVGPVGSAAQGAAAQGSQVPSASAGAQ